MCIKAIVDASVFGQLESPAMRLLFAWVERKEGLLVYPRSGSVQEELKRSHEVLRRFQEYRRSGRTFIPEDSELDNARSLVDAKALRSNDKDTIVLAWASDAEVLCTKDRKLEQDFGNEAILPKVGQQKRAIYPRQADAKTQRDFLQRRKCSRDRRKR